MTDKVTSLTLKAQVDQSLAAQGVKALRDIQAASDAAQKSLLQINDNAAKTSAEFKRLEDVSKLIQRDTSIHDLAGQFVDLGTATKDYETQLINLRQSLRDVGATSSEIDKATRAFKELQAQAENTQGAVDFGGLSKLRGIGRAANQLNLPGGQELQKVGDLSLIFRELQKASEAAGTSILSTTIAFGGMEIALGPLLLIVGAVALALIDLKGIFDLLKRSADEAAAAEKARYDQQQAQDEQDRQNRAAARSTTSEQNQQNIDDTFSDAFKKSKEITDLKAAIAQNEAKLASQTSSEGVDLGAGATAAVLNQQKKELEELQKKQTEYFNTVKNASDNLAPAIKKIEDQKKAQDDLLKSAEDLINIKKQEESLDQLTAKAGQEKLTALKEEATATENAKQILIKSGDTSKTVTDKIAAYNEALKANAAAQAYLTSTAIPNAEALERIAEATKDATKAHEAYLADLKRSAAVSDEINKIQEDRRKQVKDEAETDARQAHRDAVEQDYADRIAAEKQKESIQAVREKADQDDITAEIKAGQDRQKIDQDFFAAELKAYADYIQAEKEQTERADRERLRTLEDAQDDLKSLAASGDVAGFVERSNQAKKELKRQQEDADDAQRKLHEDYEKQVNTARAAHAKQLDDLNVSLARERDARHQAAEQRIHDIETQGQQENNRSAQLERELNDIRARWRAEDLQRQRDAEEQNYEDRLAVQRQKQAEILAETVRFFDEWMRGIEQGAANSGPTFTGGGGVNALPSSFATGLEYVPRDNYLARLDEGERVLTRRQNQEWTHGQQGGGDTITVTIQNTVGDIATKSMLDEYQEATVGGVKLGLMQAKGRSND